MVTTISMQDMRHSNLFERITRIRTRYIFTYNDTLMFCVPKSKVSKALGRENENLKKISAILKKRIRVIPMPKGIEDAKDFISAVIAPVGFKEFHVTPDEIVVTGGPQHKAALLGRNKRRLSEMQQIVKDFFRVDYRVA